MNEACPRIYGYDFYITPEGSEAALGLLLEKVRNDPDLVFINPLKERFPGAKIYLVGGIVRDSVMGRPSKDYDFLICDVPLEELQNFMLERGRIVATSDLQTAVLKFVPENSKTDLDIAVPRVEQYNGPSRKPNVITEGATLEDDLSRRDLTINAMAMRVDNGFGELVDPYNGVEDINNHLVRCVGSAAERFSEDPLRILRALRFACRYGYQIAEETWQAIIDCRDQLNEHYEDKSGIYKKRVPIERVHKELRYCTISVCNAC